METLADPSSPADPLRALAPEARVASGRARLGIGAAIVLFIVALIVSVVISAFNGSSREQTISTGESTAAAAGSGTSEAASEIKVSAAEPTAAPVLFVHVWGAVSNAGLYELSADARVVDVIAAAGGFADNADPAGVNLARPLDDGEQLYVPQIGEVIPPPAQAAPGTHGDSAGPGAGTLLDLNSATEAELETLPRIGPAMAQRIVEWRDANGGFTTVDDLRNVSGIGEKTFEGLKELVKT